MHVKLCGCKRSQGVTYTAVSAALAEPRPATQVLPEITVRHRTIQSISPNDTDSANESTSPSINGTLLMRANANAEDYGNRGHRHRIELKLFGPV